MSNDKMSDDHREIARELFGKIICGDCGNTFDADDKNDYGNIDIPGNHYWVCPNCDAVLQEPES